MARVLAQSVAQVRELNRLYSQRMGALTHAHLGSAFNLTEARTLYEIAHQDGVTPGAIAVRLGLDPGYLSRLLAGLSRRGLVRRARLEADKRSHALRLTPAGREAFAALDHRAQEEVEELLASLGPAGRRRFVAAAREIVALLGDGAPRGDVVLRRPRAGDIGHVIHRQAILYREEYGWNQEYEALIATIGGQFLERFDPRRERCWIAERDGEIVGSVFVVAEARTVAKLRLLYVEPSARGLGLGRRLVDTCVRFARARGYDELVLWTNAVLVSARRIYEAAGFTLVASERRRQFGKVLTSQTWALRLRSR